MKKMQKTRDVVVIALGELACTLAVEPIWMVSLATDPKVIRKNSRPATQNTGFFSW